MDVAHLDTRFSIIGGGSLRIRDLVLGDRGTYQCRALNSLDSEDASAQLDVLVAPVINRAPVNRVSRVKGDIEFECGAEGNPRPAVQWYKNGDLIIESDYFKVVRGSNLRILGLVEHDSGVYQCVASNSVGNVQAAAQLKVLPKGKLYKQEEAASLLSKSSIFDSLLALLLNFFSLFFSLKLVRGLILS